MADTLACPLGPVGQVTPITVMCKLRKARLEWNRALAFDGLEDSDEVVFSAENPHAHKYDELMYEYQEMKQQLEGGV
jgi:hypothetical protein